MSIGGSDVKTRSPAAQGSVCSVAGSTLASYGPYSVNVIVPVASLVAPARVAVSLIGSPSVAEGVASVSRTVIASSNTTLSSLGALHSEDEGVLLSSPLYSAVQR